jgi:hypothetical protein
MYLDEGDRSVLRGCTLFLEEYKISAVNQMFEQNKCVPPKKPVRRAAEDYPQLLCQVLSGAKCDLKAGARLLDGRPGGAWGRGTVEGKAALANERGLRNLSAAVEHHLQRQGGTSVPPSMFNAGRAGARGESHFHPAMFDLGRFAGALRWESGALAGLEAVKAGGEAGAAAESGGTPAADLLEGFLDNENIISWNQLLLGRGGATAADGGDGAFAGLWNADLVMTNALGTVVIGNEDLW